MMDGCEKDFHVGVAVSHYDHKLGPRLVGVAFDYYGKFDSVTQYNILQDSISSKSQSLALFLKTKDDADYIVQVEKVGIIDPGARGGIQRYAIVLFYPADLVQGFFIDTNEMAAGFKLVMSQGMPVKIFIFKWQKILSDRLESQKVGTASMLSA